MNSVSLDMLTKEDTVSVAIALLYSLRNVPKYGVLSELPYLVDYSSFMNLIKYYGGMNIRIPTIEEVTEAFKVLLLYQYNDIDKLDWKDALHKAGYDETTDSLSARTKLHHLRKILKTQEIGGRSYE